MPHRRRARGRESRARRSRKEPRPRYASSGQRADVAVHHHIAGEIHEIGAEEDAGKVEPDQHQTGKRECDLKKFAFHRALSPLVQSANLGRQTWTTNALTTTVSNARKPG